MRVLARASVGVFVSMVVRAEFDKRKAKTTEKNA